MSDYFQSNGMGPLNATEGEVVGIRRLERDVWIEVYEEEGNGQ